MCDTCFIKWFEKEGNVILLVDIHLNTVDLNETNHNQRRPRRRRNRRRRSKYYLQIQIICHTTF